MKVKIFGCKVNKYFTDKWILSNYLKNKKGIFVASCVVTDRAKKKWIKFVKDESKKLKNDEKIFISGCATIKRGKLRDDFYELYPELKAFKENIELLGENPESKNNLNIPSSLYTKKFILIQSGCDNHCTFCMTVKRRGNNFSRKKEDILKEINDFYENGGKEIVLTGINLGAWGLESTNDYKNSKLYKLIEYILKNSKISRIRLSSLGPEFINDKLLELFKNKRIYPHFHYSVQSGSTNILKKMNRHYDEKYLNNILLKTKNIKRDDNITISLGADIIVGFPSETQEDFEKTYNLIKNIGIKKTHIFPFSPHKIGETIPAGSFPDQIKDERKQERIQKLIKLSKKIRKNYINSQKGKTLEVLIEKVKGNTFKGWTQNYIEANEQNFEILEGQIKRNEIVIGRLID